jgi:hypothetical protein
MLHKIPAIEAFTATLTGIYRFQAYFVSKNVSYDVRQITHNKQFVVRTSVLCLED